MKLIIPIIISTGNAINGIVIGKVSNTRMLNNQCVLNPPKANFINNLVNICNFHIKKYK